MAVGDSDKLRILDSNPGGARQVERDLLPGHDFQVSEFALGNFAMATRPDIRHDVRFWPGATKRTACSDQTAQFLVVRVVRLSPRCDVEQRRKFGQDRYA